ncbi:mechanosensitive ion channel domain-containing protein [Wenyingzhuangia sp. 2_MG-2023]|uniref:mechanosensitive ion channel domain-containing protein n=1 Tax=Wenyingzhuangia sp. 2_MG-2023 TaxID=3062639 RepID=UPI0026E3BB46|nr:mechanosensitive ion channel domain-containing protein [Wenyingzhuangia sp. 2_MG-2023]MDO6738530.1 mechanosensitive ion channel [Wenyingzhuangia sp. 2_MG-2023]MDO6803247.1 mechanosensitive ion channel [Wenyingzhuangia sp. 1_MG-2023]
MIKKILFFLVICTLCSNTFTHAQTDSHKDSLSLNIQKDSINNNNLLKDSINSSLLKEFNQKISEIQEQRKQDSIKKIELEKTLQSLKTTDNLKKEELLNQLKEIEESETKRITEKKARIDALRNTAKGFPVTGVMNDTLFLIFAKIGSSTAAERAQNISKKIEKLYNDDFLKIDQINVHPFENTFDIVYNEIILMSISEADAIWYNQSVESSAELFKENIKTAIAKAKEENSLKKIAMRSGLVLLVIFIIWFVIKMMTKLFIKLDLIIKIKQESWLKDIKYNDYVIVSTEQALVLVSYITKAVKIVVYALILYITLPILFSIFPFTRDWASTLFNLIWDPLKGVFINIISFLPNLFSIIVIYVVMRYFIRFVKYIFSEIKNEKLKINGFHPDWAMPTFGIVKVLLYAFTIVLIFPHLPGNDSKVFQGVSVFVGVLFSLGSSTAISNMVAGLVITYMRSFKIGDRIKFGDIKGDVIEKTLLITRLKTVKNEIITVPNSTILASNIVNYTSIADENGLILHTTVTLGYDVPWKLVHKSLIEAAIRTEAISNAPSPFVLQTSLDDYYVSYELNAYTKIVAKQAIIYSELHQNIQDVCNENGIEILSPHYRATRDGNMITIPKDYLDKDYKAPSFNVNIQKEE